MKRFDTGVNQGSILEPIFLIFITYIPDDISSGDTTIYSCLDSKSVTVKLATYFTNDLKVCCQLRHGMT